jgi:hypothetical protein
VPQASARPHPHISHTTDYRQHHTSTSQFSDITLTSRDW